MWAHKCLWAFVNQNGNVLCNETGRRSVQRSKRIIVWLHWINPWSFLLALHLFVVRNSGCFTWVRLQQSQEQRYPSLTVREWFLSVQTKARLPMLAIVTVWTGVNACDCTRGLYRRRRRESALKVDSRRKIPCRTLESNLPQRRAGPTI